MKKKSLTGFKILDEEAGTFEAVFSTLNVIDAHGDVTLPGAFTSGAEVRISAYNHASWGPGAIPVGKGTIREEGDEAIVTGRFFVDTTAGRDTWTVVKELGDLQEWSYGYDIEDSEPGKQDGQKVTFLKDLTVHEVSPVILGAGVNTRTLTVKGAKQLYSDLAGKLRAAGIERFGGRDIWVYVSEVDIDEEWVIYGIWPDDDDMRLVQVSYSRDGEEIELDGEEIEVEVERSYVPKKSQKFSEHIDTVLADVEELTERAADVMAKRQQKGKGMGEESRKRIEALGPAMKRLSEVLTPGTAANDIDESAQLEIERARMNLRR